MITIFSTPKPFRWHIKIIQTNAIRSWVLLRPKCEVILFGDDEGTAEIASELGIRHIPEVECNEYGTPLISAMFNIAQDIASHELVCYVNADIILMSDLLKAVGQIERRPFLLVGQRWDIDLKEPVNFSDPAWETKLQTTVGKKGRLHSRSGIDYFTFPRGLYRSIIPFAVGRQGWDNWMIYKARSMKVPVIDATGVVTAVHQNHYGHADHPGGEKGFWESPETHRNINLLGRQSLTLEYATFLLTLEGLRPALTLRHLYFRLRALPVLYPGFHFLLVAFRAFEKLVKIARQIKGLASNPSGL